LGASGDFFLEKNNCQLSLKIKIGKVGLFKERSFYGHGGTSNFNRNNFGY